MPQQKVIKGRGGKKGEKNPQKNKNETHTHKNHTGRHLFIAGLT